MTEVDYFSPILSTIYKQEETAMKPIKTGRKLLSVLLTLMMLFSIMPAGLMPAAFADPGDPGDPIGFDSGDKINFPDYPAPGGVTII